MSEGGGEKRKKKLGRGEKRKEKIREKKRVEKKDGNRQHTFSISHISMYSMHIP